MIKDRLNSTQLNSTGARRYLLTVLTFLFLGILPVCNKQESTSLPTALPKPNSPLYLVTRVVDGDTIALEDGTRIRYIGMDTPETKHPRKPVQYFGKEASEANKKLVEGKKVRLDNNKKRMF